MGSDAAFAAAEPVLRAMGSRVVHCGAAGCGQATKICNNMILGTIMAVTSEAFVLAEKLGLSAQTMFDVVSTSSGNSFALTRSCPVPGIVPDNAASQGYKPGFTAALMLKDMKLSQTAAAGAHVTTPVAAEAAAQFGRAVAAGHGGEDYASIFKYLRG